MPKKQSKKGGRAKYNYCDLRKTESGKHKVSLAGYRKYRANRNYMRDTRSRLTISDMSSVHTA